MENNGIGVPEAEQVPAMDRLMAAIEANYQRLDPVPASGPGAREKMCGKASEVAVMTALKAGWQGYVFGVDRLQTEYLGGQSQAFFELVNHAFAILKQPGGKAYLVDITLEQFIDPVLPEMRPVNEGSGQVIDTGQSLLTNQDLAHYYTRGYQPLTADSLAGYLRLFSQEEIDAGKLEKCLKRVKSEPLGSNLDQTEAEQIFGQDISLERYEESGERVVLAEFLDGGEPIPGRD
jgi:hypothetical protein